MKINYQDLRNPRRTPLKEGIPLDTPFLVMIDPARACNLKCSFCPASVRKDNNGVMDWDLYVKIIEGFKQMPHRIKQLTFCKDGEPLINKRLPEMIRLAKDADIAERIWVKTNGVLLTSDLSCALSDSGADLIGVSVKALSDEGYKRVTGVRVNYRKLRHLVTELYFSCGESPKVYVSMVDNHLTDEEKEKFFHDWEDRCDYIAIEEMHGWSAGFSQDTTPDSTNVTKKIVCPFPFYTMGINFDGQVSACQEDWKMLNIVGDLNKQTVAEVWRSLKRVYFLEEHLLRKRDTLPACSDCNYIEFCPDNLDDDSEEIYYRL
jgi:radical SAM protein with 4Fe4S-binding SPASM domain